MYRINTDKYLTFQIGLKKKTFEELEHEKVKTFNNKTAVCLA